MRKAISRRCEALIKLMASHQDAGGGISRASASLVRHLGQGGGGGGSSTVESNRWWTYAALMHAIITFISWRWHVTSSGSQAVTEAGSIAFFFSTPHHSSTPNYPHSQLQAKKHKSVCFFCLVKLHNNRVKKVSVYSGTLKGLKRLWWACQASSWRCGLGIWHAAIL